MEVKKSSLIFFLYALVMFWPDYFFFGMIKYLENLLAAYAVIYVYNNRKRISGLVPSSIMRKFIYKSGRTQSAQGRETCP